MSLSAKSMNIYSYSLEHVPLGWEQIFSQCDIEILHASNLVEHEERNGKISLPHYSEVFNVFNYIRPEQVKVIMLGQDPYADFIQGTRISIAHGLSFSVREGSNIPRSLTSIFKEIKRSYPDSSFASGDLTQYVMQGVLLLNASLTVNYKEPYSHKKIWTPFLKKIIDYLCEINKNIIFVLLGSASQKMGDDIIKPGFCKLIADHPVAMKLPGFANCGIFLAINNKLKTIEEREIDWSIYPSL